MNATLRDKQPLRLRISAFQPRKMSGPGVNCRGMSHLQTIQDLVGPEALKAMQRLVEHAELVGIDATDLLDRAHMLDRAHPRCRGLRGPDPSA
jgi:hypothetical protein